MCEGDETDNCNGMLGICTDVGLCVVDQTTRQCCSLRADEKVPTCISSEDPSICGDIGITGIGIIEDPVGTPTFGFGIGIVDTPTFGIGNVNDIPPPIGMPASSPLSAPLDSPASSPLVTPFLPPGDEIASGDPSSNPSVSPSLSPSSSPSLRPVSESTRAPVTSAPVSSGDEIGFIACFSSVSTVQEKYKGTIAMKDLAVGDIVEVAGGKFSQVYSFGHYDDHAQTKFLSIESELDRPLIITANHLVFVAGSAIPASMVVVGDKLDVANGISTTVKKISTIRANGAYAPFTMDGTIVVDSVIASSYISLQPDSVDLILGGLKTILNWHNVAHFSLSPQRVLGRLCPHCYNASSYNKDGIQTFIEIPYAFAKWVVAEKNTAIVVVAILPALIFALLATTLEVCLLNPVVLLFALLLAILFRFSTLKYHSKKKIM